MEFIVLVFIIVVIGVFVPTLKSSPASHKPTSAVNRDEDPFDLSESKAGYSMATLFFLDEFIDGGGRNSGRQHEEVAQHQGEQFVEDDFEFFE